jgi:signal transduction histidine kinase
MSAASKSSKSSVPTRSLKPVAAPLQKWGFGLIVVAAVVAIVAFVAYLVLALNWRSQPFFGAMLTPHLVVDNSQSLTGSPWPGQQAGLHRSDHIVAINGHILSESPNDYPAARQNFHALLSALNPGDVVTVDFERPLDTMGTFGTESCMNLLDPIHGVWSCTVSYELSAFPTTDFLGFFIIPYVSGLVTLIIGLAVLYLRPSQPAALMVAGIAICTSLFMGGAADVNTSHTLPPLWIVATSFLGGALATLALIFPMRSMVLYRQPFAQYIPLAISAVLAVVLLAIYFMPPTPQSYTAAWQPAVFGTLLGVALLVAHLWRRREHATSPSVRDQSNTILIGLGLALAPMLIWLVNTLLQNAGAMAVLPFNTSAAMPFFVMPIISMAYSVLQYKSLDTDRIISQGITYGIMLVGLLIGYFLLVFSASLVTREAFQANDPFLIAFTIFAIAILFLPVRTQLQRRIDQLYFRARRNYQAQLEEFGQKLTSLVDYDHIIDEFRQQLQSTISPSNVFIFLPNRQSGEFVAFGNPKPETDVHFSERSDLVTLLKNKEQSIYLEPGQPWPVELIPERARLIILKPLVIAALRGRGQLNGFVCIGAPRSGADIYKFEELRFVQNLISQMAVAVERAQVVDTLESRVRELDVLSQVSQAVNFMVEFDDLLELISTQTDRLLKAPYFYIVLRDTANSELYFAFFLEDEERYPEKEAKRWQPGRDLYSEIIRTGQPLRVPEFGKAMEQRNSPILYEDHNLKAWMGVPMVAGGRSLGVLAVSTMDSGKSYGDDQLKIFSDIGSLAATSIDNARLFAEAKSRARQLGAINEVSRQLASELHVENLLDLITSSAVDILNAEAGSLLLTVDDNSGDLEFKIAVGSSGQDLVGRRFPAGRGLVGEVATSGKPLIVNDASHDPRWGGEQTKGGFSTNAVLAVPLVAKNRIVGVLEVLNKKDGTTYGQEDADLLTTFAGQAAIAIENARLFEMTDLQLTQRVDELQTLERIDVELNRSLELSTVAEITMRWAIANSGATAGILGVIIPTDPPKMEVISNYGYNNDDQPAGAEGRLWPLDRGIVSRVMRTRQADLVPDITIDPDYIPSLRLSKSQITVPMMSGGEINALLILETNKEPRLNLLDLAFTQRLTEHASIAIANAQLYTELNRANDSKSEFVSFVAHELKTPMTSIKGYTDLLLGGVVGQLTDQQQTFLGTIRSNIERMNTLVSDLNDVTKLQTNNLHMEFSPVDFRNVVTETLRPLQKQIQDKEQALVIDFSDSLPQIVADQNRLIQVLTNLVSNAHKYSPPEGRIVISGKVDNDRVNGKGNPIGPVLHVAVQDTGIGMSEEDQAKLFTPYFRSENPLAREQPGTGLGLTITRGIVERHGGEIWLESGLGKGTIFHFTVPLASETEKETAPTK